MPNTKRKIIGPIVGGLVSLLIITIAGFLLVNRQYVIDQVSVWSYQPTATVSAIGDRIALTNRGDFYFYATHPQLADAEAFNQDCPRQEFGNPILGCYGGGRIYIYDVTNAKLNGIEEVTAAHEMLHAVWERMTASQQQEIGTLLRQQYMQHADNDLKDRMEYYERTEPGQFENELHSIIGTEMATVSDELERYYARFFTDRSKVVGFHQAYSSVFEELHKKADRLYNELKSLGQKIRAATPVYEAAVRQLTKDIADFNRRAENGQFSSQSQFAAERTQLIVRSTQLEADRAAININVTTHNAKYKEYQALAAEIKSLNDSIDSVEALEPVPAVDK